ncbi:MAG: glycosyltransferase family protein [Atribacterota bacterium]
MKKSNFPFRNNRNRNKYELKPKIEQKPKKYIKLGPNSKVCILLISHNIIERCNALIHSLKELGVKDIYISDDPKKIHCNYLFVFKGRKLYSPHRNYGYSILIQTEQLWNMREDNFYYVGRNFNRCLENYEENAKIRYGTGNVIFCPLGYSPAFESNIEIEEEIHDCFFFGSRTKRRSEFLKYLNGNGIKVYCPKMIWGEERDKALLSTKININIKAYDQWLFTPTRTLLILCKKKFLLSEKFDGGYGPYVPGKHFIEFNSKHDMLDKAKYYLKHEKERKEFALSAYEDIKNNLNYTDILRNKLGDLLE